jgi:hypothetical protein
VQEANSSDTWCGVARIYAPLFCSLGGIGPSRPCCVHRPVSIITNDRARRHVLRAGTAVLLHNISDLIRLMSPPDLLDAVRVQRSRA